MHLEYSNVNDAFYGLVSLFNTRNGEGSRIQRRTSRNGDTLYIDEPVTITFTNPRQRVLFNLARDCNPFFHLYESLWMLAGRNDVEPLAYYASNMRNFSDDGETTNGAYGYRWRRAKNQHDVRVDQLDILIDHLTRIPDSRRAVLQMWNVEDDLLKIGSVCNCGADRTGPSAEAHDKSCPANSMHTIASKDVCCNLSVCFSIRVADEIKTVGGIRQEGYQHWPENPINCLLDMTVFNRSNDLIWGTLGANVVHFSMLQEYMACCLGVGVGKYHQVSNNLHVYLNNFKPEEWVPREQRQLVSIYGPVRYPSVEVPLVKDKKYFDAGLALLVSEFGRDKLPSLTYAEPFLQTVARPMLLAFYYHKQREYEEALRLADMVEASDWRLTAVEWLHKRRDNWVAKNKETTSADKT